MVLHFVEPPKAVRRFAAEVEQLHAEAVVDSSSSHVRALRSEAAKLMEVIDRDLDARDGDGIRGSTGDGALISGEGEDAVAVAVRRWAPQLHCDEMVRAASHLARQSLQCREPALRRMLAVTERTLQPFLTSEMARGAWIIQTQEKLKTGAVEQSIRELLESLATLEPQVIVERLWALATARVVGLASVAEAIRAARRITDFGPEQLVRMAAAFAAGDLPLESSLGTDIAEALAPRMSSLPSDLLARCCAAMKRIGCHSPRFVAAASATAGARCVDLETEDLVMIVCALAQLGTLSGEHLERMVAEAEERALLSSLTPSEAAQLACAFAQVGFQSERLYGALQRVAEDRQQAALLDAPPEGAVAITPPDRRGGPPLDWPVLVINLDRSPERLAAVVRDAALCGIWARRFVGIDGRHRVRRRSAWQPTAEQPDLWLKDLPAFELEWYEPQPTLGLALTGQSEQHFIGYVGSFLSHIAAVRSFVDDGFPFAVITEDDQTFHPDFNTVVSDIVACAGDRFDVINLGPLDWRFRTLEYAQRRRVMSLRVPVPDPENLRTEEELFMDEVLGRQPQLARESSYFLYWVGSSQDDPESAGSVGSWGYMVSRAGSQKLMRHMNFMWESWDDQMQVLLQGGSGSFSTDVGSRRLWAVFPPLVTSDGTWPSANVGDDIDKGRQAEPVSPHASFRDRTLLHPMAKVILGPAPPCEDAMPGDALLKVSAMALVWPPAGSEWLAAPSGWRSLFEHRQGSSNELQKELQVQMRLRPEMLAFATESLARSWTVIAALQAFQLHHAPAGAGPAQLRQQLHVLVVRPGPRECFCPRGAFRDLAALALSVRVTLLGPSACEPPPESERLDCFRVPEDERLRVDVVRAEGPEGGIQPPDLVVAFGVQSSSWSSALGPWLRRSIPVVATARCRPDIAEGLRHLRNAGASARVRFAGRNPFGSLLWGVGPQTPEPPDSVNDESAELLRGGQEWCGAAAAAATESGTAFWLGLGA